MRVVVQGWGIELFDPVRLPLCACAPHREGKCGHGARASRKIAELELLGGDAKTRKRRGWAEWGARLGVGVERGTQPTRRVKGQLLPRRADARSLGIVRRILRELLQAPRDGDDALARVEVVALERIVARQALRRGIVHAHSLDRRGFIRHLVRPSRIRS